MTSVNLVTFKICILCSEDDGLEEALILARKSNTLANLKCNFCEKFLNFKAPSKNSISTSNEVKSEREVEEILKKIGNKNLPFGVDFQTPNLANPHPPNRSNSPFNLKEFIKKGEYKNKKQEKVEVPKDIESRIKLREINESQKNVKKNRRCSESTKIMFFDKKTELQSQGSAENLRRNEKRRTEEGWEERGRRGGEVRGRGEREGEKEGGDEGEEGEQVEGGEVLRRGERGERGVERKLNRGKGLGEKTRRGEVEDKRKRGEALGEEWLLSKSTFYTDECECERRKKTLQKKRCRCEMEEGREERRERRIKYY